MIISARQLSLALCSGALAYSPLVVGVVPISPAAILFGLLFAFSLYAFSPLAKSGKPKKFVLVAISICAAITLCDLMARVVIYSLWDDRPSALSAHRWPPLPQTYRFNANIRYSGLTYGNLSAVAMKRDWREYRRINFITDVYGFRNVPVEPGASQPPPELIMLGDSFCVGDGTGQEQIWSSLYSGGYGMRVYNLCMDGAGPWQEYVNLLVESERLRLGEGTTILWVMFSGNDLDDFYHPALEKSQLPWLGPLERLLYSMKEFRYRSPLRRLLLLGSTGVSGEKVLERKFIDGRRVLFADSHARVRSLTLEDVKRHPNFASLTATIAAMKRFADEKRAEVLVVLAPSKEEVYSWVLDGAAPWSSEVAPSAFSVALQEICVRNGIRYFDLKPSMIAASRRVYEESGEMLWWRDDTHWNGLGHKEAAASVFNALLLPRVRRISSP